MRALARPLCGPVAAARGALVVVAVALVALAQAPALAAPLAEQQAGPRGSDDLATATGSTLDRTLQVDTDAAQRNVELLLETRGEAGHTPPPGLRRPSAGLPAGAASAGAAPVDTKPRGQPPGAEDRSANPQLVGTAAQFLRDHRLWLLGAVGLVAVIALGGQLWRSQRADTSQRRLRQLADEHRSPRGRRRSSRR